MIGAPRPHDWREPGAKRRFSASAERCPDPAGALRKAMQLHDEGHTLAAEEIFAAHLCTAPRDADARVAHAAALQRLGRAPAPPGASKKKAGRGPPSSAPRR
jgi:hypothetical protein